MFDALHIGQQKCASTYLQRKGLREHPEIALSWRQHKDLILSFLNYDFADSGEMLREQIRAVPIASDEAIRRVRVFSSEGLCGAMFTGAGARLAAELCFSVFGKTKILIVVREPYAMMYSIWNQYVQEGGVLSLKKFLCSEISPARPLASYGPSIWKKVDHFTLINFWSKLYGEENIKILLLEDMQFNFAKFHAELYGFLGVDTSFLPSRGAAVRQGYPDSLTRLKACSNFLFRSYHNPAGPLPLSWGSKQRFFYGQLAKLWPRSDNRATTGHLVPASVRATIRTQNRKLASYLGRDLSALGYDV